jgi:hypothetical protein
VAHHEVERREGDGLDRLHGVVADHGADAVHRPLNEASRPRHLAPIAPQPRRRLQRRSKAGLSRARAHDEAVPLASHLNVLGRLRALRIGRLWLLDDRVGLRVDSPKLPRLLPVGDGVLSALQERPAGARSAGLAGEVGHVNRERARLSNERPCHVGDALALQDRSRLVGAARIAEVVYGTDIEEDAVR